MALPPNEAGVAAAERALMDALFSEAGRARPEVAVRAFDIPGCRHRFVREALHNPAMAGPSMPESPDLMFQTVGRFMSRLPAERHGAVRSRFAGLFTPRRVERYRGRITQRVTELIDAMPEQGPVDLVDAFARPLPFTVIAEVLGVPVDQNAWLAATMDEFGRAVADQRDRAKVELGNTACADMLVYFDELLRERAADPQEDVVSLLAAEPTDGPGRVDLLANCVFFILAGHVTTTALIAAGVELLADHPDQLEHLMTHHDEWPAAVRELLRFVSPITLTGATATVDAEIDGQLVPAGTQRTLVFTAANRDPEVFDQPDQLDLTRAPNPHLAFSAGVHYCLGAPLAQMQAEIALAALFERLPGLRPAGPAVWLGSVPARQIGTLPVDWNKPGTTDV